MGSIFGKIMIVAGGILILMGLLFILGDKIPFLGKLPGDFTFKGKNITVHFPLLSCIILSVLITLILNIFGRR
jgi:thiosulfate reductase cytochrome b subunit